MCFAFVVSALKLGNCRHQFALFCSQTKIKGSSYFVYPCGKLEYTLGAIIIDPGNHNLLPTSHCRLPLKVKKKKGGGGGGGGGGRDRPDHIIQDGVIPILDEVCFDFTPELMKKEFNQQEESLVKVIT